MDRLAISKTITHGLVILAAVLVAAASPAAADGLRAGAFTAGGGTGSFGGTTFVGSFGQPVVGHDATLHSGLIVPIFINQPPVVDLNGTPAGNDYSAGFTEGSPALLEDSTATLTDVDSTNLTSLLVTLTNRPDGVAESLAATVSDTVISASYNPATGVLSLTNSDTVAHYQQVLRSVRYNNTSDTPTTTPRIITFVANDGQAASAVATTTLGVTAVNDPPVNSVPGAQTTLEDTPIVFNTPNGTRITVSDVDAGAAVIQIHLTSLGGYLVLASTANLTLTGGSNNSANMTYTGTIAGLNAALDNLTFNPTPNGNGSGHITIVTNDLGNTGSGGAQSDSDTVNITITPVNDAPVANNESYTVIGGDTLTVDATHGVLANDTDVEHDPLTVAADARPLTAPTHGVLSLAADGSFTYTPDGTISAAGGTDSFTYRANDGQADGNAATVTITVAAHTVANPCDGITEVTNSLQITRAALRYNAITGRYVQQVTLKNTGAPITGPVFLVLHGLSGGTLFNSSGTVGCFAPLLGDVYRTQPGNLGTGGSATINLEFNKTGATVTYTPRVLAGSGTP